MHHHRTFFPVGGSLVDVSIILVFHTDGQRPEEQTSFIIILYYIAYLLGTM